MTDKPACHTTMPLPREVALQRLVEGLTRCPLRLVSDKDILAMIKSPWRPFTQGDMATVAAFIGRGGLVMRALERGVLSPATLTLTLTL